MTDNYNTGLGTSELENRLLANNGDEDEEDNSEVERDVTAEKDNSSRKQANPKLSQFAIDCLSCQKQFDSTQLNASVELGLCSLCNAEISSKSFPDFDKDVSDRVGSVASTPDAGVREIDENGLSNKNDNAGSTADDNLSDNIEDNSVVENLLLEKLPVHKDPYKQNEIEGYTGFETAELLGSHFLAGKAAGLTSTLVVKIGNLGFLEFSQSRHPGAYVISS